MAGLNALFHWFGNKIFLILMSGVIFMLIQVWIAKKIIDSNQFALVSAILFVVAIVYGRIIK